jgi:hypothetical protein
MRKFLADLMHGLAYYFRPVCDKCSGWGVLRIWDDEGQMLCPECKGEGRR